MKGDGKGRYYSLATELAVKLAKKGKVKGDIHSGDLHKLSMDKTGGHLELGFYYQNKLMASYKLVDGKGTLTYVKPTSKGAYQQQLTKIRRTIGLLGYPIDKTVWVDTMEGTPKVIGEGRNPRRKVTEKKLFNEGGEVAQTIYEQLGGRRFVAMTGAKNFVSYSKENALSFKIGRNGSKANFVKITLNSMDTYDVTFGRIQAEEYKVLKTVENVYAEDLQQVFTDYTGLYTRFKDGGSADVKESDEVMTFEEFSKAKPDIKSPYYGEDAPYKAVFDTYNSKMFYYKHGRKNGTKISMKTAYDTYLYDANKAEVVMAEGGAIKGRNNSTGESFGVVIGSMRQADDVIENGIAVNIRTGYEGRITEDNVVFQFVDGKPLLVEIQRLSETLEGKEIGSKGGKSYNASSSQETVKELGEKYSPAFAKRVYEAVKEFGESVLKEEVVAVHKNGDKTRRDMRKSSSNKNWIQKADETMEEKGTVGSFTKQAEGHGMTSIEFAKEVLSNPKKHTIRTRKRAQFVKNSNPELFATGGYVGSGISVAEFVVSKPMMLKDGGKTEKTLWIDKEIGLAITRSADGSLYVDNGEEIIRTSVDGLDIDYDTDRDEQKFQPKDIPVSVRKKLKQLYEKQLKATGLKYANGGGVGDRFIFGVEYKESPTSRVFKKSSLTMVGNDNKDMNSAINKNAELLKTQEGWHEVKITKTPVLKNGGGVGEYAKGGSVNSSYLDNVSEDKKNKILRNIANHYGVSLSEAEAEVKDSEAEMLYEYITNDTLRTEVYRDFENKKYANGGEIIGSGANVYKFFFNGKEIDLRADSLFSAKTKAVEYFKAPKSKAHMVHGVLLQAGDKEITHSTSEFKTGGKTNKPYRIANKDKETFDFDSEQDAIDAFDEASEHEEGLALHGLDDNGEYQEMDYTLFCGEFKKGGQIKRADFFRDDKNSDAKRLAKPTGYRFRGNNYEKPTKEQIAKGLKSGKVYFEDRAERSDMKNNAKLMLESGGQIMKDGGSISKGDSFYGVDGTEYKIHSKAKEGWFGVDENGKKVNMGDLSDYARMTRSFHEEEEFAYGNGGGVDKNVKGKVLRTYNAENGTLLEIVKQSHDGSFAIAVNGKGLWASDSEREAHKFFEDEIKKYETKYNDGGKIKNQYKNKGADDIWTKWTKEQREHFVSDHLDLIKNRHKAISENTEIDPMRWVTTIYSDLPDAIRTTIIEHKNTGQYAKGGFVGKGEMVWNKLTSSKRAEFLYENFTPEITPRSQEILVGKSYKFLPKNVKIKIEAKYANVEEGEYAKGGGIKSNEEHLDNLYKKSNNNVQGALELYAGELGIYNMFFGHKVDANKKAKYKKAQQYLESKYLKDGGSTKQSDKEVISENGRYITISATKDLMTIKLTKEGIEELNELRASDKSDYNIMTDLFEDIRANSELVFHWDLGESGFGLTSGSGVSDGYYMDDDGEYTNKGHKDSRVYYFSDYMIKSEVDELLNNGELVLQGADNKFAKGGKTSSNHDVEEVLKHYVMSALWSTSNMDSEEEEFLDENYSFDDVDKATLDLMRADIKKFISENADAIKKSGMSDEQLGHDLWLSRNGHGAGFFDRGYSKDVSEQLQNSARKMKGTDLYVSDGNKIMYGNGGKIKRADFFRDDKNSDAKRLAKPTGHRFRGNNYEKPTKEQIARGLKSGKVYYEDRAERSDMKNNAKMMLADGGKIGDMILVSDLREALGHEPNYPYQNYKGCILTKCMFKPYYKIVKVS